MVAQRKLLTCPNELFEPGPSICEGNGSFRRVYVCKHDDRKVVKIVRDKAYAKYNRREYRMYMRASAQKRLLMAAVYGISEDGTQLVMERTNPCPYEEYTNKLSRGSFDDFDDTHANNIGKLPDGRIVIHDYAGP